MIELRNKGYFDHKEAVKVEGGREKLFSVDMKPLPNGPTPEQVQRRKQGMSSFGAKVNPVGGVTADFGIGYPYYFTARLTVGAFNLKPFGLDLGVEFQTFFDIYDLSLHARWQFLEAGPASTADPPTSSTRRPSSRWPSARSRPFPAGSSGLPGPTRSAPRTPRYRTASPPRGTATRPSG